MNIATTIIVTIFLVFIVAIGYIIYKNHSNRMVWKDNDIENEFDEIERLTKEIKEKHE